MTVTRKNKTANGTPKKSPKKTPTKKANTPKKTPTKKPATPKKTPVKKAATPNSTPKKAATTPKSTPKKAATTPKSTPKKAATTPKKTPVKKATTPKSTPKKAATTPKKAATPKKATETASESVTLAASATSTPKTKKTSAKSTPKSTPKKAAAKRKATTAASPAKKAKTGDTTEDTFIEKSIPSDMVIRDHNDSEVDLYQLSKIHGLVIFAYPAASTPGCTKQVCFFRDTYTTFKDQGYLVFGLSNDAPKKNHTFHTKQNLTYPLLSDPAGQLISFLGIGKDASHKAIRSAFVIPKGGQLIYQNSPIGPEPSKDWALKIVNSA